jgi:hypothetical protein
MSENQTNDVATAAEIEGLAEIRRRRNLIWGWPVAAIPIMLVAGNALGEQSVVVFVVWASVFFGLVGRHLRARCPRCHKFYNFSERRRHSFAEACVRCGLELAARQVR